MTGEAGAVTVRPARAEDVSGLIAALSQPHYFAHRFARQPRMGILLVALQGDATVVGSAFLRLAPAEEWELRERLRKVPVLTHVEVVAGQRRNGVGRKIVQAAEEHARRHGRRWIALGVKDDNNAARQMYNGLGYEDWGRGPVNALVETFDDNGGRTVGTESCQILVKSLFGAPRDGG
ncbi:GNAT family N-acetyltransferase [Dactylosporangium sp. NPDC000555]|uniref:GNAT family N-acetyltransferase n=1 Tax=Dactylosporangium sp. NPDC000555 TaxID=3154260 RepID=UPI0033277812